MKKAVKSKKKKLNEGITLIALVVTIVILLILAGVSISMLAGEDGIITQSKKAKDATIIGEEMEQVKMAYDSAKIRMLEGDVTEEALREELDDILGDRDKPDYEKQTVVSSNGLNDFNVLFKKTEHNFNVNQRKGD